MPCKNLEVKMPVNDIFGTTIDLLGKTMDLRIKNQSLIAGNLANAETPGYAPMELSFEDELKEAVKGRNIRNATPSTTNPRHIPLRRSAGDIDDIQGRFVDSPARTAGKDGNSVELEKEMGRMAENQVMYNASVQILAMKFNELKTAIKGGN
jgi:flagellar basal-body rod protein FlgB